MAASLIDTMIAGAAMNDETLARLLAENVAYQAAFRASILVLKDVLPLVVVDQQSRAAAARSKDVLTLVRGEFLALPAGFREDLNDASNRYLRAKLTELLSQIDPLLAALDPA